MQQYIAKRILLNIPVIFLVVTLVFLAGHVRPSFAEQRAAQGLPGNYQEALADIKHQMGTDKPFLQQYGSYLWDTIRGDFGTSLITQHTVFYEIRHRLAPSFELGLLELLVALVIALPVGVIAAIRQDTWLDYILRFMAVLGLAVPSFYLATLGQIAGFRFFGWAPPVIYHSPTSDLAKNLQSMAIPAVCGGLATGAVIMRLLRSQLLEVLRQDYVRTAWSKGLKERTIIIRHAMKNAMIPVFTIIGMLVGALFGGNVVLETMFVLPGMGQFVVVSFLNNDLPMVQGVVLMVGVALVMANIAVDLSYAWLDPRIRYR